MVTLNNELGTLNCSYITYRNYLCFAPLKYYGRWIGFIPMGIRVCGSVGSEMKKENLATF